MRKILAFLGAALAAAVLAYFWIARRLPSAPPEKSAGLGFQGEVPAPERSPARLLGSPAESPANQPQYTNEILHEMLEQDKKNMGIKDVIAPGSDNEGSLPVPPSSEDPMAREQFLQRLRGWAQGGGQGTAAKEPEPVPIEGEVVPVFAPPQASTEAGR